MKRVDVIVDYIVEHSGFSQEILLSRRKQRPVTEIRQLMYWLIYENCPELSLPDIGRLFDRDHTTIHHAIYNIARIMPQSENLKFLAAGVRKKLQDFPSEGPRRLPTTLRRIMLRLRDVERRNKELEEELAALRAAAPAAARSTPALTLPASAASTE